MGGKGVAGGGAYETDMVFVCESVTVCSRRVSVMSSLGH